MLNLVEYRITWGAEKDRKGDSVFKGSPTLFAQTLAGICEHVARNYGGYTLTGGRGGWVNDQGQLVEESTRTLSILVDVSRHQAERDLSLLAIRIGEAFNQDSIVFQRAALAEIIAIDYDDY